MSKDKSWFAGQRGAPGLVNIPGLGVLTYSASRVLRKTHSFVDSHHRAQRASLTHA